MKYHCLTAGMLTLVGASVALAGEPIPDPIPLGDVAVTLEPIATGLTAPNWGTHAPCPARDHQLFVVDQAGTAWVIDLTSGTTSMFLDVSALLVPLGVGGEGSFDERGFLGLAFHPDFATNGRIYTYTSEPVDGPADFSTLDSEDDANHQAVIREWTVPDPCDPASVVDPGSVREVLRVDEPQFNHDGGALAFGPGGMLFIALGDGGGSNDVGLGHTDPGGNGQDPTNVLGTLLRIDPLGTDGVNGQYGIPVDNPYVGVAGFLDEIFAYGLRNPFRFSFDLDTQDLYIGDVGQGNIEEVNRNAYVAGAFEDAGANYGWNEREGTFCFDSETGDIFECPPDPTMIDPIAEYDHGEGISVIGGFVYRGTDIPDLEGRYVFGDWNQSFFGNDGRVFYLDESDQILEMEIIGDAGPLLTLSVQGFGQDAAGEIYLLGNLTGTPFETTGMVLKLGLPDIVADPIPDPVAEGELEIVLDTVASGLTAPNWGTSSPCLARANQLFVVDQVGLVWTLDVVSESLDLFLDVQDLLVPLGVGGKDTFDERGLLGLAFHPDFASNGLLYTYTSQPVDGPADFSTLDDSDDANHQAVITEWTVPNPCQTTSVVDPGSAREILRVDEPQFNHDGGALAFGPDGMLFVALGDGGGGGDTGFGHSRKGNGLDPSNVLGTLLRIDPLGTDGVNGQYGVPVDNPFVGVDGFVDEIFVYGLRNPFRFSFDSGSGDLYIGDVGQGFLEELNINRYVAGAFEDAGANYGWRHHEGTFCYDPTTGGVFECSTGEAFVGPVAEYDHDEGISIIGGFVYRGDDVPALEGTYIFGDYSRTFFGNNGRVFYLDDADEVKEFLVAGDPLEVSVLGFGQDYHGEVYLMSNTTGIPFGDTGTVKRISAAVVAVEAPEVSPERFLAVHPNPARGGMQVPFELVRSGAVTLRIYDVAGHEVATLVDATLEEGRHVVSWDGRDDRGIRLPAGRFFARLSSPSGVLTRSITLVR
jgi:glucose/arabinose dehydrogenase